MLWSLWPEKPGDPADGEPSFAQHTKGNKKYNVPLEICYDRHWEAAGELPRLPWMEQVRTYKVYYP